MKSEAELFNEQSVSFSDTTMRLMLDGSDLLKEVEVFLKGYYDTQYYDDEKKVDCIRRISVGEPKVNERGLQSTMFWLKTKITPLLSMGNMSEDQYNDFLHRTRRNMANNFMRQRINYGMTLSNYTEIIDVLMETFEAFYTSAINAGHRRSFTKNSSIETKEYVEKDKKKILGVFG